MLSVQVRWLAPIGAAMFLVVSAHAQVAGFTPGTFGVDGGGAATYSVPLFTPPGTAGVEPKLALAYKSGGGNGRLGMGWALSGLSAITRCPQTLAQDNNRGSVNLDANDRFCLDGQRLMVITGSYGAAGSVYGTELEAFSKVTANGGTQQNGPDWFEVRTKSGLILQYGYTTDSRFKPGGSSATLVWGVNKISDTKGNYLTVSYTYDNPSSPADWYPLQIDYTFNTAAGITTPNQTVKFLYEDRSDVVPSYVAGYLTKTTKRLLKVQSWVGPTASQQLVREYGLSYDTDGGSPGRSRLTSLQECSGINTCLPVTSFATQRSTAVSLNGSGSGTWWLAVNQSNPMITAENLVADFDGDGKMDLAGYQGSGTWRVCLSTGDHFNCALTSAHSGGVLNNFVGDYDGDGKSDLMTYSSGTAWNVCLSNGSGGFVCSSWNGHAGGNLNNISGDFDGDGRTDIAAFDSSVGQWQVCVSSGSSGTGGFVCSYWAGPSSQVYNTITGDFNGDGRTDLAAYTGIGGQWAVCLSTGTAFDCGSQPWNSGISADVSTAASTTMVGDFNGDGKTDMAAYTGTGSTWAICLSTGTGFACDSPSINWRGVSNTISGDFNGDGKTDLLTLADNNTDLLVCFGLYVPAGSFSCTNQSVPASWSFSGDLRSAVRVGDFNGDGLADVAAYNYTTEDFSGFYEYNIAVRVALNAAVFPDLITTVTNGLGHVTNIQYQPLTNYNPPPLSGSTVYNKDITPNAAVFPDIDLQVPMWVVQSASIATAVSADPWSKTTYLYGGAKVNMRDGRGFKGFRWREETAPVTSIKTHVTNLQTWPYIGMPSQVTRTRQNGTVLVQTDSTYGCLNFVNLTCTVAYGQRYFPFATQSTTTSRDLNNSFITTVRTSMDSAQIDSHGNVKWVEVKHLDSGGVDTGYVKTTTSTYPNDDETNWLIGRLATSAVASAIPGLSAQTRSTYFGYDTVTGLLSKEVVEPGNSDFCLVTEYSYDSFGNKTSATTRNCNASSGEVGAPTGTAVFAPRTSHVYFDTSAGCAAPSGYVAGRFSVRNVNALGHFECLEHDAGFGGTTKLTGPNGLVTTWQYDEFGRKKLEVRPDGTKTQWEYLVCNGAPCPGGATYRLRTTPQDPTGAQSGPISSIYYDVLNREMRAETQGFDGTAIYKDTTYDSLGRIVTVTRPYYSGQALFLTSYQYDDLNRVTLETLPTTPGGTAQKSVTYNGLVVTETLSNNGSSSNMPAGSTQVKTITKNSQGQVVQVTTQ